MLMRIAYRTASVREAFWKVTPSMHYSLQIMHRTSSHKHTFPQYVDEAQGMTCKRDANRHVSPRLLFHTPFISSTICVECTGSFHGIISVECNFLLNVQHGQRAIVWLVHAKKCLKIISDLLLWENFSVWQSSLLSYLVLVLSVN